MTPAAAATPQPESSASLVPLGSACCSIHLLCTEHACTCLQLPCHNPSPLRERQSTSLRPSAWGRRSGAHSVTQCVSEQTWPCWRQMTAHLPSAATLSTGWQSSCRLVADLAASSAAAMLKHAMSANCDADEFVRRLPCRAILEGVDKFGNLFVQVGFAAHGPQQSAQAQKKASPAAAIAAIVAADSYLCAQHAGIQ